MQKIEDPFDWLLKLLELYKQEADKCGGARAYLAGCTELGAALEAGLLAMAICYSSEIKKTYVYVELKKRKGRIHLRDLTLSVLLQLARELEWIPSNLPINKVARESGIDPDQALAKGDVGYFADVVREIRNLVHPSNFLERHPRRHLTKKYFEFCYEMLEIVFEYFYAKLVSSIKDELGSYRKNRKDIRSIRVSKRNEVKSDSIFTT